jgi:DNA-binding MarR family transcriptional regulator
MLSIEFGERFATQDISLPQYLVLSTLHEEPGLSSAEVARRCFVSSQAANVIVARLEATKLIRRVRSKAGGRALEARLTKHGEAILAECRGITSGLGTRIFESLTHRDIDATNATLAAIAGKLDPPVGKNARPDARERHAS